MVNNGHQCDGVSNVNVSGNRANPNIQNTNRIIQGQGQDQDQGGVPYVPNGVLDMANNGHEGDGISNVNVAGNSANSNIQNTDTTIQAEGQGQWQGRVPYLYNGVYYPRILNNVTNVQTNYTYPNPATGMNPNGYTYPNPPPAMDMNPNGYTYPNPTPPLPPMDMNPNGNTYPNTPPAMDMNPNGYTYAIPPPAIDMNPNGYAYPNPRPAMDVNINGYNGGYYFNQPGTLYGGYYGYYNENPLNYIHNNHYYPPYADGFYQLQQQPQLQSQPRPRRLFDAGRGRSSGRHSSGRYSNAVQAGRGRGRGRGRAFRDNNYTNNNSNAASLSQDVGNITERLIRMAVSESEGSTQVQGQGEGHAEHIVHANANADAAEGFSREISNAKFFVITSYSRENVASSMQHGVWTSTRRGNKILAAAYGEAHHEQSENASRPVFLFFSVKGSGNFCGVAEMDGPVDFKGTADCWDREWKGKFPVKWNIIKDVPYNRFQHITINTDVGNQNQIPVIYTRDTQEVEFEKGAEMMDIFNSYASTSSLLDNVSMSHQQEGEGERGEEKQKQENTEEEKEGKKGEKECEQSCSGSNSCDTNADHIQQEVIEESPTELKLQEIVNSDETTQMTVQEIKTNVEATCHTEETQQTDVDSSMPAKTTADPPKATSGTGAATQVTQDNTGDTHQIMTPPETVDDLSNSLIH